MRQWSNWITDHWEVSILTLIALGISTYDLVVSAINPSLILSTDRKIDLILLLLAAYILNAAKRFSLMQTISDRLILSRRAMPRCLDLVRNRLVEVERGIHDQELTFTNRHEVMDALLKMIDGSHKSYHGLNFYGQGWRGRMSEFYDANIGAVRRGVKVTRYFVIKDEYIVNGTLQYFIDEMDRQADQGIHVFFIRESEIKTISHFRNNPIRGIGLFDDQVLVIDRSLVNELDGPIEMVVHWNPNDISQKNPFPHLQGHVKPYLKYRDELATIITSQGRSI